MYIGTKFKPSEIKVQLVCTKCGKTEMGSVESFRSRIPMCSWCHEIMDESNVMEPGDCFIPEPKIEVICKFCRRTEKIQDAHFHNDGYVCERCWDERLRSTE